MNSIEDILRESFEARVEHQPALREPAERAITGARAVRRRRAVLAACAAIIAVVLAISGLSALPRSTAHPAPMGPPTGTPSPAPSVGTAQTPVTMHIAGILRYQGGNSLVLPDGFQIKLNQVEVSEVYQTADGWVGIGFVEQLHQGSLWLVTRDHRLHVLLAATQGQVVLSADGRQFAWEAGGQLKAGHLSGTTLTVDGATPAPTEGQPIAISGPAVALGGTHTGGGTDRFDVWLWNQGRYQPTWDRNPVVAIYGPAPDGHSFLGLVPPPSAGTKDPCFALLEPAEYLRATRTTCIPGLPLTPATRLSPDGHWLAVQQLDNTSWVGLIDLTTVFDHPVMTKPWPVRNPLGWVDGNTLIAVDGDNRTVRCVVGQPDAGPFTVAGVPAGADFIPIPVRSG